MHLDITTARKLVTLGQLHDRTAQLAPDHVDTLVAGELILAAAAHILPTCVPTRSGWPFNTDTLPPDHDGSLDKLPLNNLVKAMILLEAEIDRRLRAERAATGKPPVSLSGYSIESHDHDGRITSYLHKTHGRELNLHGDLTQLFEELADLVSRSVNFTDPDVLAEAAYSNYVRETGGVTPTGESAPTWAALLADPVSAPEVEAWRQSAVAAVLAEVQTHPIGQHALMQPQHARQQPSPALVGG
jgi:hypothetical protein